ncbi:MAG: hypothetical protein CM1200mP2_26750 [Planctomycetaceae bacterium]|nr:MAG: hypothetical protein CM1200mP2_26750 [Planctomycetaceae bacterium]
MLSHFPVRRLEVEAIRDSMLAVSGRLNDRLYGAPMYPFIPKELFAAVTTLPVSGSRSTRPKPPGGRCTRS